MYVECENGIGARSEDMLDVSVTCVRLTVLYDMVVPVCICCCCVHEVLQRIGKEGGG